MWQSTVHDSLDLDAPLGLDGNMDVCYNIAKVVKESIEAIPTNFYRLFGRTFDLPITCEVGIGPNLGELKEYVTDHSNS